MCMHLCTTLHILFLVCICRCILFTHSDVYCNIRHLHLCLTSHFCKIHASLSQLQLARLCPRRLLHWYTASSMHLQPTLHVLRMLSVVHGLSILLFRQLLHVASVPMMLGLASCIIHWQGLILCWLYVSMTVPTYRTTVPSASLTCCILQGPDHSSLSNLGLPCTIIYKQYLVSHPILVRLASCMFHLVVSFDHSLLTSFDELPIGIRLDVAVWSLVQTPAVQELLAG